MYYWNASKLHKNIPEKISWSIPIRGLKICKFYWFCIGNLMIFIDFPSKFTKNIYIYGVWISFILIIKSVKNGKKKIKEKVINRLIYITKTLANCIKTFHEKYHEIFQLGDSKFGSFYDFTLKSVWLWLDFVRNLRKRHTCMAFKFR